jgi:GATA zinc finger
VPQSVVSAQEVEDLIPKVQMLNDSYRGIREAVLSSSTSVSGDENKEVVRLVMHNGYGHEVNGYSDDSKNFGPPDSKKRRGVRAPTAPSFAPNVDQATSRAAPPGRCHSCNRAETPEWRRGPDGARTLCNACGLRKSCGLLDGTATNDACRLREADEEAWRQQGGHGQRGRAPAGPESSVISHSTFPHFPTYFLISLTSENTRHRKDWSYIPLA